MQSNPLQRKTILRPVLLAQGFYDLIGGIQNIEGIRRGQPVADTGIIHLKQDGIFRNETQINSGIDRVIALQDHRIGKRRHF